MTDFPSFLPFCVEVSIRMVYFKEYGGNIAIQLCIILYNIANFGNYGKPCMFSCIHVVYYSCIKLITTYFVWHWGPGGSGLVPSFLRNQRPVSARYTV